MFTDEILKKIGIKQYGYISTSKIIFLEEVRSLCEKNACGMYGKSWGCPPGVGTLKECQKKCLQYSNAMVFNAVYDLEDSFDWEGMIAGQKQFKNISDQLYQLAKEKFSDVFMLSNEGCGRCEQCTYPKEPCRFPDLYSPPIESFGIYVSDLAKEAGLSYNNGANTVTYFGMLLFN